MKSGRTVEHALADMLDAAEKACAFCGSLTVSEFAADDKSAFAVIHALAILGEAAKQVPEHIRLLYPDVPFRTAAGLRDKLIHDYFGVRRERLWQTVQGDLPGLIRALQVAIASRRAAIGESEAD